MARSKDGGMKQSNDEQEELLVFGYSCKLFRDDERALYIDQGKHLIPWMGDESLKIDRYDARGTLYDLKPCEPISGGFDMYIGLTDSEKQVELLCDEERYRALHSNEEEEAMYQEEELKRLHMALNDRGNSYGQVGYSYDNESQQQMCEMVESQQSTAEQDDEVFVPSPLLDLPTNMVVPETVKHNAIIEKTAMFISTQGLQMEILLKMKQSGNDQFNFLSFDSPLHSYYRHLLTIIKAGRYNPQLMDTKQTQLELDTETHYNDDYLHPSLVQSVSKVELAPSIPSISYKPSADCAYSMLVNKIKQKTMMNDHDSKRVLTLKSASARLQQQQQREQISGQELSSTLNKPPTDVQLIIDKMASYVAKNGRDFENIVKGKSDLRFEFLQPHHIYHQYYLFKLEGYTGSKQVEVVNDETSKDIKNKITPVCFSIKKPKETETCIDKSALPVEESSDDECETGGVSVVTDGSAVDAGTAGGGQVNEEAPLLVDIAAVEDKQERTKKILAAERVKDKLTAAVREKVALMSKEKQVQLERKRKVAAFLKSFKPTDNQQTTLSSVYDPLTSTNCDDDDEDVFSILDTDNHNTNIQIEIKKPAVEGNDVLRNKLKEVMDSSSRYDEKMKLKKQLKDNKRTQQHVITLDDSSSNEDNNDGGRGYSSRSSRSSRTSSKKKKYDVDNDDDKRHHKRSHHHRQHHRHHKKTKRHKSRTRSNSDSDHSDYRTNRKYYHNS